MTTINVRFIANAGEDCAGESKAIDVKRAQRLARQGYVVILEEIPEAAVTVPEETAARPRGSARGVKPERRG